MRNNAPTRDNILRYNLCRPNRDAPYKIFFADHHPRASVHELRQCFERRFNVDDVSLHDGYGFAYVNDLDAERKVYAGQRVPLIMRGKPLFISDGMLYRHGQSSLPLTNSAEITKTIEKPLTPETTEDFVDKMSQINWRNLDPARLRSIGEKLQGMLKSIQTAYKEKMEPPPQSQSHESPPAPMQLQKFATIRDLPGYNSQESRKELEKTPAREYFRGPIRRKALGEIQNNGVTDGRFRKPLAPYEDILSKHMKSMSNNLERLSPISNIHEIYPFAISTPQNSTYPTTPQKEHQLLFEEY